MRERVNGRLVIIPAKKRTKETERTVKRFWVVFLVTSMVLWGAEVHRSQWKSGETFSEYLQRYGISQDLLKSISDDDSKYLSEIQGGEPFYEMLEGSTLIDALIPIGEEMQIELSRDLRNGRYRFDIVPIVYRKVEDEVLVRIEKNCYSDIDRLTRNPRLGFLLKRLYKGSVDFRKFRAGDKIAFVYDQKSRLGRPWGPPHIRGAVVEGRRGKPRFIFVDEEGNAWQDIRKTVRKTKTAKKRVEYSTTRTIRIRQRGVSRFVQPLPGARITSRFAYKRWHPILHRYRPHLGVDYGARRGTPIHATGSGRVIYAGWMRGYGKVVKIDHGHGYVSLYAHQSRLKVRRGSYVKRGEVIGYVGSTGRSTGPHLHFGLYRHGRAIDPLKVLGRSSGSLYVTRRITTHHTKLQSYTKVTKHTVPIKGAAAMKKRLEKLLEGSKPHAFRWETIAANLIHVEDRNASAREENLTHRQ